MVATRQPLIPQEGTKLPQKDHLLHTPKPAKVRDMSDSAEDSGRKLQWSRAQRDERNERDERDTSSRAKAKAKDFPRPLADRLPMTGMRVEEQTKQAHRAPQSWGKCLETRKLQAANGFEERGNGIEYDESFFRRSQAPASQGPTFHPDVFGSSAARYSVDAFPEKRGREKRGRPLFANSEDFGHSDGLQGFAAPLSPILAIADASASYSQEPRSRGYHMESASVRRNWGLADFSLL